MKEILKKEKINKINMTEKEKKIYKYSAKV